MKSIISISYIPLVFVLMVVVYGKKDSFNEKITVFVGGLSKGTLIMQLSNYQFTQSEFQVKLERVEVLKINKELTNYMNLKSFKYNRTVVAVNASFSFSVEMGYESEVLIQAYKFMSNEYRYFPLRFQVKTCEALEKNMIGVGELSNCGNFTGCPLKKNVPYFICNWKSDATKFPPMMPSGKYMVEVIVMYHNAELFTLKYYGTIDRPIVAN